MATNRLVEAVPARIRFSTAPQAPSKRNILIRNTSLGNLPVQIDPPDPPFHLTHGADQAGHTVILKPQETMGFGVMVDRAELPAGKTRACSFLVVRVDMCPPLPIDFTLVPEDMSKEQLQFFVKDSMPHTLTNPSAVAPMLPLPTQDGQQASAGGAQEALFSARTAASSSRGAPSSLGAGTETGAAPAVRRAPGPPLEPGSMPAMLAAFLGEAPAPAALVMGHRGPPVAPPQTRPVGGRRRRDDSPPDTPGGAPCFSMPDDIDDDRPPTPNPAGFDSVPRPQATVVPKQRMPASASSAPSPRIVTSTPSPSSQSQGAMEQPLRSFTSSPSPAHGSDAQKPKAEKPRKRPTSLPPPSKGPETDGLFFMEGLGWCDEYGEVVQQAGGGGKTTPAPGGACNGAAGGGGGLRRLRSTSRTRTQKEASLVNLASASRASVKARTGGCGLPRPGGTSSMVALTGSAKKITQAEMDANWEAMGGI